MPFINPKRSLQTPSREPITPFEGTLQFSLKEPYLDSTAQVRLSQEAPALVPMPGDYLSRDSLAGPTSLTSWAQRRVNSGVCVYTCVYIYISDVCYIYSGKHVCTLYIYICIHMHFPRSIMQWERIYWVSLFLRVLVAAALLSLQPSAASAYGWHPADAFHAAVALWKLA